MEKSSHSLCILLGVKNVLARTKPTCCLSSFSFFFLSIFNFFFFFCLYDNNFCSFDRTSAKQKMRIKVTEERAKQRFGTGYSFDSEMRCWNIGHKFSGRENKKTNDRKIYNIFRCYYICGVFARLTDWISCWVPIFYLCLKWGERFIWDETRRVSVLWVFWIVILVE